MDFVNFSDKVHAGFPVVSASPSAPLSLYHAQSDVVFVNTGSGWQAGVQPSSGSVYPAVSAASPATKTAIITSVSNTSSAPSANHTAVAIKATSVINQGH